MDAKSELRRILLWLIPFYVLARYAAAPVTGFVLDDWNYLNLTSGMDGFAEVARTGFAKDLNRPLSTMFMTLGYWTFGLNPQPYLFLLFAGNLAILLLAVLLVWQWTDGDSSTSLLFGICFATLPWLTESYHFPILAFAPATLGYPLLLASAYGLTRYAETGRSAFLALAWLPYAISLFSYEVGAFLPAAFAVLLVGRQPHRKALLALAGFAVCFLFYLVWRQTAAFGLLRSTTPAHMRATGISVSHVLIQAKELARWCVGDYAWLAWRQGWEAFARIPGPRRALLVAFNIIACVFAAWAMSRIPMAKRPRTLPIPRRVLFAGLWFVASALPALLSYVVSRLLVLPAMAVWVAIDLASRRLPRHIGIALGLPLLFLALLSAQGTNWAWNESAIAHRRVFQALRVRHAEWAGKRLLVYDSRRLREAKGDPDPVRAVAFHGNAPLFRGSGLREMAWLVQPTRPRPLFRLDVEYNAEIHDDEVRLRGRYDPQGPITHRFPRSEVYVLDLAEVLGSNPHTP